MLNNIKWYIKQIFPLSYSSSYESNGRKIVSIWKMWLGRCYKHRAFLVEKEIDPKTI